MIVVFPRASNPPSSSTCLIRSMAVGVVGANMFSVVIMGVESQQIHRLFQRRSPTIPALEPNGTGTLAHGTKIMKTLFLAFLFSVGVVSAATFNNSFTTNSESPARRVVTNIVTTILSNSPSMVSPTSYGTMTIGAGGQFAFPDRPNIIPAFDGTGLITEVTIGTGLNYDTGTATLTASGDATTTSVLAGTNNAAVTNLTLSVLNAMTTIDLTNNATSTNFTGLAAGTFRNATFVFRPLLVNRTNCYPIGTQYGQTWKTNVNAPLFTTLTQGVYYVLSLTTIDDTVLASMSAWQP